MSGSVKYASRAGAGWGTELPVMFVFGFLVATILWLGLWFLWEDRPRLPHYV